MRMVVVAAVLVLGLGSVRAERRDPGAVAMAWVEGARAGDAKRVGALSELPLKIASELIVDGSPTRPQRSTVTTPAALERLVRGWREARTLAGTPELEPRRTGGVWVRLDALELVVDVSPAGKVAGVMLVRIGEGT